MPPTYQVMVQCTAASCRRWASVLERELAGATCGACGSAVEAVDMEKHRATLPVSTDDPSEVAKFNHQKGKPKG